MSAPVSASAAHFCLAMTVVITVPLIRNHTPGAGANAFVITPPAVEMILQLLT
jgi:hypothetical protein